MSLAVVTVLGAKGGCGASLVATNLALALAHYGETILVDLHLGDGVDDLLLDVRPERSWADLLPVAGELSPRHLELSARAHPAGARLLAGPVATPERARPEQCRLLLHALSQRFDWTVIDSSTVAASTWSSLVDMVVIVATADPPALRNTQRWLASLPTDDRRRVGLVLNQFTRAHPAHPASVAASLECSLLGVLPADPRAVGFQVSFGHPCLLDVHSGFGRGVAALAGSLAARRHAEKEAAECARS